MRPLAVPLLVASLALVVPACGGGDDKSTTTATAELPGIGTSKEAWDASHEADPEFTAGSSYDPDPSLVPPGGNPQFSDRYYTVQTSGGRVESYEMRFAPGTSIAEAKSAAMKEFPSDAKVDWFREVAASGPLGPCARMQVQSKTLTGALDRGKIAAFVEFSSGEAANSYRPSSVTNGSFVLLRPTSPSDAIAC